MCCQLKELLRFWRQALSLALSREFSSECSEVEGLGCKLLMAFLEGMSVSEWCEPGMNECWGLE